VRSPRYIRRGRAFRNDGTKWCREERVALRQGDVPKPSGRTDRQLEKVGSFAAGRPQIRGDRLAEVVAVWYPLPVNVDQRCPHGAQRNRGCCSRLLCGSSEATPVRRSSPTATATVWRFARVGDHNAALQAERAEQGSSSAVPLPFRLSLEERWRGELSARSSRHSLAENRAARSAQSRQSRRVVQRTRAAPPASPVRSWPTVRLSTLAEMASPPDDEYPTPAAPTQSIPSEPRERRLCRWRVRGRLCTRTPTA
jgi:hypothetical protein